jgi:hypothetical protein
VKLGRSRVRSQLMKSNAGRALQCYNAMARPQRLAVIIVDLQHETSIDKRGAVTYTSSSSCKLGCPTYQGHYQKQLPANSAKGPVVRHRADGCKEHRHNLKEKSK